MLEKIIDIFAVNPYFHRPIKALNPLPMSKSPKAQY
jgi:hypothetical protein